MTLPVFAPDGPEAQRVEIWNGVQNGPATLTGQFGTRLDYTNAGAMCFFVDVIDVEGNRLTLYNGISYNHAIIEAENAARDWGGVPVDDIVGPGTPQS